MSFFFLRFAITVSPTTLELSGMKQQRSFTLLTGVKSEQGLWGLAHLCSTGGHLGWLNRELETLLLRRRTHVAG